MKKTLLVILSVLVLASCSAPKYSYNFSYHDYNAGRKAKEAKKEVAANPGPVAVQPEMLVADAPVVAPEAENKLDAAAPHGNSAPLTLSKSEKKGMVKDIKQAMKKVVALTKSADAVKKSGDTVQTDKSTKALDADLKMSLVFLIASVVVGIVGGLVGGGTLLANLLYILGAVLVIIAIIYFVRWLMRQ